MEPSIRAILFAVSTSLLAAPAHAALVTHNFRGTIFSVTDGDAPIGDVGGISVGDPFDCVLRYDASAFSADQSSDPRQGLFLQAGAFEFDVTINGRTFAFDPTEANLLEVLDNAPLLGNDDMLTFTSQPGFPLSRRRVVLPPGWTVPAQTDAVIRALFGHSTGAAFSGDDPPPLFDRNRYDYAQFDLVFDRVSFPGGADRNVYIIGDIDLTPAAVPEPSGAVLLSFVGGMIALLRRRNQHTGT